MLRFKHIWTVFPLPEKLKLIWSRLTSSRLATFYFALTIAHCLIQVTFQATAYVVNTNASVFLNELVNAGGLGSKNFTLYDAKAKQLRSCWGVPNEKGAEKCITVWAANGGVLPTTTPSAIGYYAKGIPTATSSSAAMKTSSTSSTLSPPTVSPVTVDPITPLGLSVKTASVVAGDDVHAVDDGDNVRIIDAVIIDPTLPAIPTPTPLAIKLPSASHRNSFIPQGNQRRSVIITPVRNSTDALGKVSSLQLGGLANSNHDDSVNINLECIQVLRWPVQTLRNTQREDIVFLAFNIWVLGMSFVALLNESIPHIVAALLTHILATMWAGFQLANTQEFRRNFLTLTVDGACRGVNLLPNYWKDRGVFEISMLALNGLALIVSALLSWKIFKAFGWATFRRIGADRKVNHIYKIVLVMSALLQLSLFFILASMALWLDQLCFGYVAIFSSRMTFYKAVDAVMFVILVPWLALGWFGVRKENKNMMYAFLGISVFLLAEWAFEFLSDTWRLTFLTWDFFAIMAVVAAVLTLSVTLLGLICFRNFGEGLSNFLKPDEAPLGADFMRITSRSDAASIISSARSFDEEKISFPQMSNIPTYNMPFGNTRVPPVPRPAPSIPKSAPSPPKVKAPIPTRMQHSVISTPSPPRRARTNSTSSSATHESDTDPFYLAKRMSVKNEGGVLGGVTQSRWSKGSSELEAKPAGRRWMIE